MYAVSCLLLLLLQSLVCCRSSSSSSSSCCCCSLLCVVVVVVVVVVALDVGIAVIPSSVHFTSLALLHLAIHCYCTTIAIIAIGHIAIPVYLVPS